MADLIQAFRKNLKILMQKKGWNQAETARRLGWEPAHLSNYLKDREPGLDKIAQVAGVFGLSIEELFAGHEVSPRSSDPDPLTALRIIENALKSNAASKDAAAHLPQNIQDLVSLIPSDPQLSDLVEKQLRSMLNGFRVDVDQELRLRKATREKIAPSMISHKKTGKVNNG